MVRALLILSLLSSTALAAHAQDAPPAPATSEPYLFVDPGVDTVNGAIGVCVRWTEADHSHVTDVVIVEPSGDAKVDADAPAMIRSIPFPMPMGYTGEWIGLGLSFTGAPPRPEPDCETAMKAKLPPAGAI